MPDPTPAPCRTNSRFLFSGQRDVADPAMKARLAKLATDTNVNIKTNNLNLRRHVSLAQLRNGLAAQGQTTPDNNAGGGELVPPPPPPEAQAKPDPSALTAELTALVRRIPEGLVAADPPRKETLATLARQAQVNLKTGNLTYAAADIKSLRRAMEAGPTVSGSCPHFRRLAQRHARPALRSQGTRCLGGDAEQGPERCRDVAQSHPEHLQRQGDRTRRPVPGACGPPAGAHSTDRWLTSWMRRAVPPTLNSGRNWWRKHGTIIERRPGLSGREPHHSRSRCQSVRASRNPEDGRDHSRGAVEYGAIRLAPETGEQRRWKGYSRRGHQDEFVRNRPPSDRGRIASAPWRSVATVGVGFGRDPG